jgi:hypothetical protein
MTAEKNDVGEKMDSIRFVSLLSMFAASAYQNMGKLSNPLTGKVERNLDAAQGFIDVLSMLRGKTKGNLSAEEEKMINSMIGDLQMNFVQEKAKPEPEAKPETGGTETKEEKGKDAQG